MIARDKKVAIFCNYAIVKLKCSSFKMIESLFSLGVVPYLNTRWSAKEKRTIKSRGDKV